jgi:hypothetical protein
MTIRKRLSGLMVRPLVARDTKATDEEIAAVDLHHYFHNQMVGTLSPRYRRLVQEVLRRLPLGWNKGWIVRMEESKETSCWIFGRLHYLQVAVINEGRSASAWVLSLCTPHLDSLSDDAVRWILAYGFGNVAACPPPRLVFAGARIKSVRQPKAHERAEAQALDWGFSEERRTFEKESRELEPRGGGSELGQTG